MKEQKCVTCNDLELTLYKNEDGWVCWDCYVKKNKEDIAQDVHRDKTSDMV